MAQIDKISDAMFGPGVLDSTVCWIKGEALKENTREAYSRAALMLQGIDRLWISYRSRKGYRDSAGLFESVAISNELRRLENLRDSADEREQRSLDRSD